MKRSACNRLSRLSFRWHPKCTAVIVYWEIGTVHYLVHLRTLLKEQHLDASLKERRSFFHYTVIIGTQNTFAPSRTSSGRTGGWLPLTARQTNQPSPSVVGNEDWSTTNSTNVEVVTDLAAFQPFSYGPANCAGKNIAQLEMRMVLSRLMHRFSFELTEGYDPRDWERNIRDCLVVVVGELPVTLTRRT